MEERELLALARSDWTTALHAAFQDDEHLYLVMEYLAGGSLLGLLYREGKLPPATVRFYAAEAVLAVHSIHQLGFAYRYSPTITHTHTYTTAYKHICGTHTYASHRDDTQTHPYTHEQDVCTFCKHLQ
jgi:serine/threonine protein kinase